MLPSNLARVPTFLSSRIALTNLGRTNASLLGAQNALSSGRSIGRASEDPIRASSILSINDRTQRTTLHRDNLQFASGLLGILSSNDGPLGSTVDMIREAKNLASSQIGLLSDPSQRRAMAATVDSYINTLFDNTNFQSQGLHLFGGSTPGSPPIVRTPDGGFRYVARGSGLLTDLGIADQIPITLGGNNALGETSARQLGSTILSPNIDGVTRLSDLRGVRGLGATAGPVSMNFNAGPGVTVDLSGATSINEVNARLSAAIAQYETDQGVTILGPGGVSVIGQGIRIDVVAGGTLNFSDLPNSSIGLDLGLTQAPYTPANTTGAALSPRLTLSSVLANIPGVNLPLDSIRVKTRTTSGVTTTIDINLSSANTIDDLRNAVEAAAPGVRIEVNAAGNGLDVHSEIAGRSIAIEDVPGAFPSAQQLGLRTFRADTPLSVMNYGRGVTIVDGVKDPTTGTYARRLNTDLKITLGNGQWFDVDLRPQDMVDVTTLLNRINAEFTSQVGTQNNTAAPALAAGEFDARVSTGQNGIAFFSAVPGAITAEGQNNSAAADQLGLKSLTLDGATGEYIAQDRAGIRVDNLFTHLIELRDALLANDSTGITFAGEDLTQALDRLTTAQAVVGSYDQRVQDHINRLEDSDLLDKQLLSNLQDTDFAEASVRLSNLSLQLQATLQSVGQTQGRTLFDFLS